MGVVGFQDYWVTCSRFYFDRDGTTQGQLLDLGVIDTAQPSFEVNKIELQDGDGGRLVTVDSEVTSINENYEITIKNFNTETLSLMFLANEPTALNQTALGVGDMTGMKAYMESQQPSSKMPLRRTWWITMRHPRQPISDGFQRNGVSSSSSQVDPCLWLTARLSHAAR